MFSFEDIQHPYYKDSLREWEKWRLTYKSGDEFIDKYLKKFSKRESDEDFANRRAISYVPAFAKSAVNEVKDSIFQRIADVTRTGGSESYKAAILGKNNGVDNSGTSMNSYIGSIILPELLSMKRVGTFIDMPAINGTTIQDELNIDPYIYHYTTENIVNWDKNDTVFNKLLLRDYVYTYDDIFNLPVACEERYRYMWVENGVVYSQFYNKAWEPLEDIKVLNLTEIPFVKFEITDSLLRDTADYQISLLNLASADMAYSLNSNFPFYVEQFEPRIDNLYQRPPGSNIVNTGDDSVQIIQPGESADAVVAKNYELKMGTMTGRRIPRGLDMPRYIHPSSEPLEASMKKQQELKNDIKQLTKLAVSNLSAGMASAESKSLDERSLEAGLSAIGLELERGESKIAKIWQMYIDPSKIAPTIKYPQKYRLQSDKDQRDEASQLSDSVKNIPSITYKREAMKIAVDKRIGSKVSSETLEKIQKEIDTADVIFHSPEELSRDVELTLVDPETASLAKGYPEGSVEKANTAHAERVKRIAESQSKARGATDLSGLENVSREEKMNKDESVVASKKTRGEEK